MRAAFTIWFLDIRLSNYEGAARPRDPVEADLTKTILIATDLFEADLIRANLYGANLSRTNFTRAKLSGANFSLAFVANTLFVDVDLSEILGLDSLEHTGPSHITMSTIYKSKGQIPEIFLRNAGVPSPFIVKMKALVAEMEPIQFYSCFISYSTNDQDFAEQLYADLQANNVPCFYAGHDMKGGKKIHQQIDAAIGRHDNFSHLQSTLRACVGLFSGASRPAFSPIPCAGATMPT